ncbi:cation diffusion facilitator CzcD-associated flavoprotein CzcO [Antricoccus suffuscus]|uniref:Cation diffusion facilitator CzcD-associated flavoprotein CzcO n=1 Tax=Antricoccus suffuscus TaxID=1629062 RepID=A0A2T0ZFQ4_9ACTN|nr:NAD(P)/FAD-dependent oxidoreductase [Antricoccus suffuscus]PRZ35185.1 cation diffusion facilitator CzcD-associated flavoprotein CzcO [Antricoccus suffuscus]
MADTHEAPVTLTQDQRDALRERYREERDKRIRPDGINQYVEPTGQFAVLEEDPYTPWVEREALTDHVEFLFVGGGFAGLSVCARLKEAGIDDFRIVESGGDFGGVWYWNRYPGAMCDTAAMVYLPLLEETGHMPTMKYVRAPEIWGHALRIATHYDLYPHAVFSTQIHTMTWNDDASHWVIETNRGDRMTATYVAMGTGPLNRPKLPGVPGIESFAGDAFHTARWDYEVTGGDWTGEPMTKLAEKRVGIVGTGATGIQIVPSLGRDAGELYVFQRTPSAVGVRGNHEIDPDWFSALEPGWQSKWLRNFAVLQTMGVADEDLVHDGWTDITKRIFARMMANAPDPSAITPADFVAAYHDSDDEKMEEIRGRVDEIVEDPETAAGLKAWYRQFCKRPCFHDEYLPTFNRPNVHLVDTDGKGVERIDETGAWVGDKHYDLDVLIYASGFEFNTDYTHRSAFEVVGRGGVTLTDKWAKGMQSFQGMHVHGFPNMFVVGIFQGSSLASNVTSNYVDTGHTIAAILTHAQSVGAGQVEVLPEAETDWVAAIEKAPKGIVGGPDCTPGYYNSEGQAEGRKEKLDRGGYPLGPVPFFDYIADWRTNGRFEGLAFR